VIEGEGVSNEKWLDQLREDCEAAFTARAAQQGAYSSGETFWVPSNTEKPKTTLEALALEIYRLHAGHCDVDPETSGAEWWTLVVDEDDDVAWHWDRDYGLEGDTGFRLHPHIGSVTYLSNIGAPTLILEAAEDPERTPQEQSPLHPKKAHWSCPSAGKHVSFDGRHLHAAPLNLASEAHRGVAPIEESGKWKGKRITFLVNIWLNHRPQSVVSGNFGGRLSTSTGRPFKSPNEDLVLPSAEVSADKVACDMFNWSFGNEDEESDDEDEGEEEEEEKDADKPATPTKKPLKKQQNSASPAKNGKTGEKRQQTTKEDGGPVPGAAAGGVARSVELPMPLSALRSQADGVLPHCFSVTFKDNVATVTSKSLDA